MAALPANPQDCRVPVRFRVHFGKVETGFPLKCTANKDLESVSDSINRKQTLASKGKQAAERAEHLADERDQPFGRKRFLVFLR
jgi:hypothetical protein